jgi:nitroimidazol reductase NimA-like FMN-containing flavoprotein (pyridoxamine 5'-phosphate oxidase superfamily)
VYTIAGSPTESLPRAVSSIRIAAAPRRRRRGSSMSGKPATPRTTVRRLADRGRYGRDEIRAILDEGFVAHVGFVADGQPYVIPMGYGRDGDWLYLHGSPASRMLRALAGGAPVCVTVTLVDGLVVARSAFHSSMNYRSVVVLGVPERIEELAEKRRALDRLVEHLIPGRTAEARPMTDAELKGTLVVRLSLEEASAKVRTGPPKDDEEDYALQVWAGVLPLVTAPDAPVPDPRLAAGIAVPASVTRYRRRKR